MRFSTSKRISWKSDSRHGVQSAEHYPFLEVFPTAEYQDISLGEWTCACSPENKLGPDLAVKIADLLDCRDTRVILRRAGGQSLRGHHGNEREVTLLGEAMLLGRRPLQFLVPAIERGNQRIYRLIIRLYRAGNAHRASALRIALRRRLYGEGRNGRQ